jgi:hypothetical protein
MTTTTLPSHAESDSNGNNSDNEGILKGKSIKYDLHNHDDSSIPYF